MPLCQLLKCTLPELQMTIVEWNTRHETPLQALVGICCHIIGTAKSLRFLPVPIADDNDHIMSNTASPLLIEKAERQP